MAGDNLASTIAEKTQPHDQNNESQGWLRDNVLNPFINGSGVRQIADTFTGNDYKPLHTAPETGIINTAVQTVSSVVGGLAPYVVLGKVTHGALGSFAEKQEIAGLARTVMKSEATANIGAAGVYEFLKKPTEGQTRLGNTAGTMLSFSAFEAGNYGLGKLSPMVTSRLGRAALVGTGRALIGGTGGELQYETSNYVASLTGGQNRADNQGRIEAIASGAVMNEALPVVQHVASKAISLAMGAKPEPMKITLRLDGKTETVAPSGTSETAQPTVLRSGAAPAEGVSTAEAKPVAQASVEPGSLRSQSETLASQPETRAAQSRKVSAFDGLSRRFASVKSAATLLVRGTKPPSVGPFNGYGEVPGEGLPHVELTEGAHADAHADAGGKTPADGSHEEARPETTDKSGADKSSEKGAGEKAVETDPRGLDAAHVGKPILGSTFTDDGINFGVNSPKATNVELLIYSTPDAKEPSQVLQMAKTGDVWHRTEKLPEFTAYQYRASGENALDANGNSGTRFDSNNRLLDPEALAVYRADTGDEKVNDARAIAVRSDFDWQGVKRPGTAMEDTIIYEMNVRGFTGADAELGDLRGTYRGLISKIPYLKSLGVTAIELMPVMEFQKDMKVDPATGKVLINAWGYNTVGFKAVEGRYAHDGTAGQQVAEFKEMVRELHKNGIEVIMDVVFNHTGEGGADGKPVAFKGLNNDQMYLLDKDNKYVDHTGCGNTVNANDPEVTQFIIRSLRYWVEEMQVDGFRFDLAKALKYMPDGSFNDTAPLIEAIRHDPVLSKVKLIAEPWDMSGYGPGRFAKGWAEWNGVFRDTVRNFVRGLNGQVKKLGDIIAGSSGAGFDPETGQTSVNFITAHDGFTMNDLVSYKNKHNEANGENNRDGADDNASDNNGQEGPVERGSAIDLLRVRQIKNLMSWLFFSEGAPMLLAGDEMRRTQDGNNNAYNQDDLNKINWNLLEENAGVFNFAQKAIALHKALKIGHMRPSDLIWHGATPEQPDWGDGTRFIARQFKAVGDANKTVYVAANAWEGPVDIQLPAGEWRRIIDTNLPDFQDIKPVDQGDLMDSAHYRVMPFTTVAFVQDVPTGAARPIKARVFTDFLPPPNMDKRASFVGLAPQVNPDSDGSATSESKPSATSGTTGQ